MKWMYIYIREEEREKTGLYRRIFKLEEQIKEHRTNDLYQVTKSRLKAEIVSAYRTNAAPDVQAILEGLMTDALQEKRDTLESKSKKYNRRSGYEIDMKRYRERMAEIKRSHDTSYDHLFYQLVMAVSEKHLVEQFM